MYHTDVYVILRNVFSVLIKNSLRVAKNGFVVVSGEADLYAEFPGTSSSSDKVFWSICEILDNAIKQSLQLRPLHSFLVCGWAGTVGYNRAKNQRALKYVEGRDLLDRVRARYIASDCGSERFGLHETDCGVQEVYRKTSHLGKHFFWSSEGDFVYYKSISLLERRSYHKTWLSML